MSREQYLEDKKANRININGAYEMYVNINPKRKKVPYNEFIAKFQIWLHRDRQMPNYWKYFDNKFEILTLNLNGVIYAY